MKALLEWNVDDVCEWLEKIGLGEHCVQFRENEILGEHLLEITKEDLTDLGVKKIGHKKIFFKKVRGLKAHSYQCKSVYLLYAAPLICISICIIFFLMHNYFSLFAITVNKSGFDN